MKLFKIYTISIVALVLILVIPNHPLAETNGKKEIDISTSPKNVLFNTDNIKPGDTITREITIKNNGLQDFRYLFTSEFSKGSKMFYDALLLTVKDKENILFDGMLKDFKELEPRPLLHGTFETLELRVEMPYELGNEYQGLNAKVSFKFYADGKITDKPDEENPESPGDKDNQESPSTLGTPTNGGGSGTPQTGTAIPAFSGGLPQTGESMPTIYYLIGGLLIAFGFALYASGQLKRRRE
ncbi:MULTISPECIES: LPXTG cell wall anchor domain-containing protein [Thalassobacillus]|uniref:LPXTG cell wall anchor domain-containing protein n=1 Tax=Thalassobacillus TaxID=331971 RepID=UPI000A1CB7C9|nr:LPXTG cell wall anchor domain-containing protein [Thalassobacillus devorans]